MRSAGALRADRLDWTIVRAATAWPDERHSGDLVGARSAQACVRY